jgi:dolichol-phosphate mannosyltransferase
MTYQDERSLDADPAGLIPSPRRVGEPPAVTSAIGAPTAPEVSVIVPTRNEAPNVEPLLRRLELALADLSAEVIFVDDSDDDTPNIIRQLRAASQLPVHVHHRTPPHRAGGLGGAVSEGLRICSAPYAVVIDGDLQHPPETIPELFAAAREHAADIVVGSRYAPGGNASGLAGGMRRLVSSGTNLISKVTFPRRLHGISDVMSGFFLVRVAALASERLQPDGYKILLELLVTSGHVCVREVGFTFGERHAGTSNASMSEGVRFLRRLFSLRVPRPLRFALVGASGTMPNLVGTALLHRAGLHYLLAAGIATQLAILWNFAGCELLVWQRSRRSRLRRYLPFAVVNNLDLVFRLPLLAVLVDTWHIGVGLATFLTLLAAVVVRYLVVDRTVYRERSRRARHSARLRAALSGVVQRGRLAPSQCRRSRGSGWGGKARTARGSGHGRSDRMVG